MGYSPNFTGAQAKVAASSTGTLFTNNSGLTIAKLTPVRIDSNGELQLIDLSQENAEDIVGIVSNNILDTAAGEVLDSGRLPDITTSAVLGKELFITKLGLLSDVEPAIGVASFAAGDWVISVGRVIKNVDDPLKKDLLINISLRGIL